METSCAVAFKEWAVICHALATGQQTLILRKGGIHEGRAGFRVAYSRFLLFPTYLHQADLAKLTPSAWPELANVPSPDDGMIHLSLIADVTDVIEIQDQTKLAGLTDLHWWSQETIDQRFHYREPGLFLLIARVSRLDPAIAICDSPRFAGCRSWVELDSPITISASNRVLSDDAFELQRQKILEICR